ncbi:MAG: LPS export ABC transporter periplasmic protein LptC [Candidatus Omnitrophota bacterium]|jgi:LPS export ABC transporter protein LptC
MFKKILICAFIIFLLKPPAHAAEEPANTDSGQQINDFSLSGYGEKGKKSWDVSGKSADIFNDVVKMNKVVGNMYGDDENIKLTSERGDFNKAEGKVHLQDNVVITTSSGAKLTTDSLDWDRKAQFVSTKDLVNIQKDGMTLVAIGARGETNLKTVALEKNVRLDIDQQTKGESGLTDEKNKIIITCDGPLEIDYEKNVAVFKNNVKVERPDSVIYSDKMDVFFIRSRESKAQDKKEEKKSSGIMSGSKIDRIVARGNVKVTRGQNTSFSDEAVYSAADQKLILSGRPKLVIYSTEDLNAPVGN